MNRSETPVVLCIDVEPDPRAFDPTDPPPWLGFERLIERLPALRQRLSDATGRSAAFTWLLRMDPQVAKTWGSPTWVGDRYGEILTEFAELGDELGLHTHVWRWDEKAGEWYGELRDPRWGEHCVATGLDAFETAFGRTCAVHRGGDRFLSGAMMTMLEKRGVSVDLTVEPGLPPIEFPEGEVATGRSPDYRGAPARPYRSSASRFPAPEPDPAARNGPLLVPMMSVRRRRPPFRRIPLTLWADPTDKAWRWNYIRRAPIVAFTIRSNAVFDPGWKRLIEGNLEHLAHYPGVAFKTASAAVESVEGGSQPS